MEPASRMPLCGNGRIDTEEDYRAYYANHTDEWVSVPFKDTFMDFRFIVPRERCDGTALLFLQQPNNSRTPAEQQPNTQPKNSRTTAEHTAEQQPNNSPTTAEQQPNNSLTTAEQQPNTQPNTQPNNSRTHSRTHSRTTAEHTAEHTAEQPPNNSTFVCFCVL
jgi:hypothetical protein